MDSIEFNINQLCSGYKFIDDYIFDVPTYKVLVEADNIYKDFLYENRFENMLHVDKMEFLLIRFGLWSVFDSTTLQDLPKKLDSAKLLLFQNFFVPSQRRRVKTEIERLKDQYNDLSEKRHSLYQYTVQHLADRQKQRHIVSNILLNKKYKPVKVSALTLEHLINEFIKNNTSVSKFREIAKSNEWSGIWSSSGPGCFRVVGPEQRQLISYTKFYENIGKHPECPNSDVIEDDDALDGWLLHIKAEQTKERKKQLLEKITSNKGTEQFVFTQTAEDASEVFNLNDPRGKMVQNKIHAMRKADGVVNEFNIQEIRQEATIQKR